MRKDEDKRVKVAVIDSLGRIGDSRAVEQLKISLRDDDWEIRDCSAMALNNIGWEPKSIDEQIDYFIALKEWKKLVEIGSASIKSISKVLSDKNISCRIEATDTLGDIGDPKAVNALCNALNDKGWIERWSGIATDGKAVTGGGDHRYVVVKALGKIKDLRPVRDYHSSKY